MTELNDHDLLAEFARSESESAFAALVSRHVNLVHSAALRFTGNAHHAQEITQAVFIILARKGGSLGRKVVVSGWLYQTARLTAANFLKAEIRRQQREQEACMTSTLNEPDAAAWEQLAPLLDEAMGGLGETDRNAVVLRFFENKTAAEAAAALNMTEAAAHKRTARALEKLRKIFSQRGVTLTSTLIASAVSANSVQAAPADLAATAAAAAKGATISATLTTLVKGTMKTMTWLKIKFAVGLGAAALLAGGAATVAVSQADGSRDRLTSQQIIQKSQETYAALTSYSSEGKSVATLSGQTLTHTFSIKLARPNLYRITWEQAVHPFFTNSGVVWSSGAGDFLIMNKTKADRRSSLEDALGSAAGISGGASATIPGAFFSKVFGSALNGVGRADSMKRMADEKVGDVDCFVFADEFKGRHRTIWVGKKDFLIHQSRTVTSAAAMKIIMADAAKQAPAAAANLTKVGFTDTTSTETHENIVVNKKFSPSDFAR